MSENTLKCETCNKNIHEVSTPIFEKPLRVAFKSNMKVLPQNTSDNRKQENICLDCFTKEIVEATKDSKTIYRSTKK